MCTESVFGVLFGGIIGALFSAWVIYCVGDTNEKVEQLQEQISALKNNLPGKSTNAPKAKPAQQPAKPAAGPFVPTPAKDGTGTAIPFGEGKEQCSVCGTVQNAGRNVCWNCGTKFRRGE